MLRVSFHILGVAVAVLVFVCHLEEGVAAPPGDQKPCIVRNINVQKGFSIRRFQGRWYDIARVHLATDAVILSSGVSKYSLLPNGDLRIEYGGESNGRCIRPLVATGRQNSTNRAKMMVSFDDVPDAFLRGAFWVIETNYEHAIIYACYKVKDDGTCNSDEELAYILSRNRTLRSNTIQRVNWIVRSRLCIDINQLKPSEYKFPCPPDSEYDVQKYLDRIITGKENETDDEEALTTESSQAIFVSTDTPVDESSLTPDTVAPPLPDDITDASVTASDPDEILAASWTDTNIATIFPASEGEEFNSEEYETTTSPARICKTSDIPAVKDFNPNKFLGQWFVVASTHSANYTPADSSTGFISRSSQDDVLYVMFTGLYQNSCVPPVAGRMKRLNQEYAIYEANFVVFEGEFRILYVDEDYNHAIFRTCINPNRVDDTCQSVIVEIASRTNQLSPEKFNYLMNRASNACVGFSDFTLPKHEVQCQLPACKVENSEVHPNLNWTQFAGNWFTVHRLKGKFPTDSGLWKISESVNGNIYATYIASRFGKCLTPIRAVWTPKLETAGEYVVSFGGFKAGIGKILQTDYHMALALYYGCEGYDSDGNCIASNAHLEEWHRIPENASDVSLLTDQLLHSFCIFDRTVENVRHEVSCDVAARCRIPEATVRHQADFSKLLGTWKVQTALVSGKNKFEAKRHLNEITFKSVGGINDTIIICFTLTNRQNVCQTSECRTFELLFSNQNQRQTEIDSRERNSAKWKLVYVNDHHLGIYVCRKVDDWGGTMTCDPSGGILYVFGRNRGSPADALEAELEPLLEGSCLSWSHQLNFTVSCPAEVPSYSRIIKKLPGFTVNIPQFMGIWYIAPITGNQMFHKVSKLRLLLDAAEKINIILTNSIDGTCQLPQQYLATMVDESGIDWVILRRDRYSGHFRILYADHDIAVAYFCRRLWIRYICAPGEGKILLLSRVPSLDEEKQDSISATLSLHGYSSIDDIVRKTGFESSIGWNISFAEAAGCSLQVDENLCPIESLPVMRKLLVNRFLGHWFVVSRLKNSPSFDSAELRLTPGKEISIAYWGKRNGTCQKPIKGKLIPLVDGFDSQFEVDYGNGHFGRFQVVYTNYRVALVYQCLQLLTDGSCLPGQVAVELLSRVKEMSSNFKSPLIRRTQDLCVNQSEMIDTSYDDDCEEDASARCFIENFPHDTSFSSSDLLNTWFVRFTSEPNQNRRIPFKIDISETNDKSRLRYVSHYSEEGNCYSSESDLLPLSSAKAFQMVFDFKENNKIIRIIEMGYGMMLVYTCKFVEVDGKCRPGFGGVLVLAQNLDPVSEEIVIHYGDILPELCLEPSADLVQFYQPDCKSPEPMHFKAHCNPVLAGIPNDYAQRMFGAVWQLAGRISEHDRGIGLKYFAAQDSDSEDMILHSTEIVNGKCLPTSKVVARLNSEGFYEVAEKGTHVEFTILYSDDDAIIKYVCASYDSVGRCEPEWTFVEVFTKNASLPQLAEEKLRNVSALFNWCLSTEDFKADEGHDCPLLVEPECTISVPPMRMVLDLEKLDGYWFAIMSRTSRNSSHITAIEIELSEDKKTMSTFLATSHKGHCYPTIKSVAYSEGSDNFRWRYRRYLPSLLGGYLLLLHVDDDHLVLLECTSEEQCTPETASAIDIFGRTKAQLDDSDKEKIAKLLRRICHEMDNFALLINDLECVVELRPQTSECVFDYRNRQVNINAPQLTGTWYGVARSKRSGLTESEMFQITSEGPSPGSDFFLTSLGSRRGQCLLPIKGRFEPVIGKIPGRSRVIFNESLTDIIILFTDYRFLVTLECRGSNVNDSCDLEHGFIAMYTRDPVDISSIIPDLLRIVKLDDCFNVNDFVSLSHDASCSLPSYSCFLDPNVPVPDNFTTDLLFGVWYSLYQLRSTNAVDSYTIRFHRDDETGSTVAYFVYSSHRECQSPVKFLIPYDNYEWRTVVENKQVLMKVLAYDPDHIILYQCLDYHEGQNECHPDATRVDVLGRSGSEEVDPVLFNWVVSSLKQSCVEIGDMEHVRHSVSCRLPIIKRTGCQLDKMPVARNIDFNKLGGVWYSYYILQGATPIDYSTKILQPAKSKTYSAIFRYSRKDECLSVQTAAIVPRDDYSLHADFDAKFKSYTTRFRVLYTDYNYALIYTCTVEELTNGQCPTIHRHVAIYGRHKTGQLPENVKEKIFEAANEACVYEEDFVPATHVADCDIPYSGRHSCHLDHVITHDDFELREIFGSWQLLSHTNNRNRSLVAESIRFTLSSGGVIKYTVSGEDSLGLCQRLDETVEPAANQNATFYVTANGKPAHVMKVLFMNSQYLILYICHGHQPAGLEVCEDGQDEVKIFGRMSVMGTNARKMLTDIIWSRICLSLDSMVVVKYNSKCDLAPGCDIGEFVLQENFEPQKVIGTWQVLIRSSFRPSSSLPGTAKFALTDDNISVVRVLEQSSGHCHSERLVMKPVEGDGGMYQTQFTEVKNRALAQTLFLYASDRHFVTLDCFGELSNENECTAEKVELTVWGRNWDLGFEKRRTLLQEIQDRTLRCYAIHAMVDIELNDECELPSDVCSLNDFALQKDFDGRMMLGQWHLTARSPLYKNLIRIGDMRIALSGDVYHIVLAGKSGDECFEMNSSMKLAPERNSTFLLTSDGVQTVTQIIYWSDEYLLRLDCVDASSEATSCHPNRTGLQLLSRTGYMDEDTMSYLMKITRERTRSCVKTHNLEPVPFAENTCPHSPPAEGGDACSYDEMQLSHSLNTDQINGLWFRVLSSNRVGELSEDSVMHHLTVKDRTVEVIHSAYRGSGENGSCVVISEKAKISPYDSSQWYTAVDGQNDTIKVIYIDEDILITYECYSNKFDSNHYCHHDFEHLQVSHRRRHINRVELKRIFEIVTKKTCFAQSELILEDHTRKCEVPGIISLDFSAGKLCDVDSYKTVEEFNPKKFSGIWYEAERTRFSGGKLWESGIFNFSLDSSGSLRFLYSGTVAGHCIGPVEGHTKLHQHNSVSSDLVLTLGLQDQSDHPWAIQYRLKILLTDYNSTAVIYSCHSMSDDGRCHMTSEQVFILSRQPKLDIGAREQIYEDLRKSLCFDVLDFVRPAYEANCYDFVSGANVHLNQTPLKSRHPGLTTPLINTTEDSTILLVTPPGESPTTNPPLNILADVTSRTVLEEICAIPMCQNHCPGGYARDERGCETCDCSEITQSAQELKIEKENDYDHLTCPTPVCADYCPHGYPRDERGCEICYCVIPTEPAAQELNLETENQFDPSMCPIPLCANVCPRGYARDERGCETCNCIVPPEPVQELKLETENPFDPSMCAIPMCANFCPHGYARDERGCETCNCAATTDRAQELKFKRDSNFDPSMCAIPMCLNRCDYGYALDERGCETCHCRTHPTDATTNSGITGSVNHLLTNEPENEEITVLPTEDVQKETPIPDIELEALVDEVNIPEMESLLAEHGKARATENLESENDFSLSNIDDSNEWIEVKEKNSEESDIETIK